MTKNKSAVNTAKPKGKPRGKPFKKGDPRINKDGPGKIKGFYELRALARQISEEEVVHDKKIMSRAEKLLRELAASRMEKEKTKFLEIAFGKVPDKVINSNFDIDKIMDKVDLKKLTPEQLEKLSTGSDILEVLLADYL